MTNRIPAAIPAPRPPAGSFDPAAAARGKALFNGKAQCATCHVPPLFTEPGNNIHTPAEIGIDDFQANRAPAYVIGDASGNPVVVHGYRTAPLKGLWAHQKGGFFHDGRFSTLNNVVDHHVRPGTDAAGEARPGAVPALDLGGYPAPAGAAYRRGSRSPSLEEKR